MGTESGRGRYVILGRTRAAMDTGSNQGYSFRSNELLEKLSQTGTVRKVMMSA